MATIREFSADSESDGEGLGRGTEEWGLRGARRRREKVCFRLPADSLKTERLIWGTKTAVAEEEEGEEERDRA